MQRRLLLLPLTFLLLPALAQASPKGENPEKRCGAYFEVLGDRQAAERLPLESTRADVNIAGTIAHVRVEQVYKNDGSTPIEAVYVFPGSTRSAVFGLRMKIGERTIEAKIDRKDAARRTYEAAKRQGKSASLLEQERPNVFKMNVANIMPGDRIVVSLDYTELLVPTDGVYELVYPTTVGPRFSEGSRSRGEAWISNPYKAPGAKPDYTWDIRASIAAGTTIRGVRSPSHRIKPTFTSKREVRVDVDDPAGGNRDFVLKYRLSGAAIETGMLLFPGAEGQESFFLMQMEPPRRPRRDLIPPREYIFVLDVSGSMRGHPLNTAKGLMKELMSGLRPRDRVNVMTFSGDNQVLAPESLPATRGNIRRALSFVGRRRGGGGTRLLGAMRRALALPRDASMSTTMVVVTDGYVSVEKETFELIRESLGTANLFAFGIGSSVNRFIIEGMARAGHGEPFIVDNLGDAEDTAHRLKKYVDTPVLTNIHVDFGGFDAYDVEPKAFGDLFARRPVVVFGKYRGRPDGTVRLTGSNGRGQFERTMNVSKYEPSSRNTALRYLWARHRVMRLSDFGRVGASAEVKEEVTQLGLQYNLMTQYTSFVAVDSQIRNHSGPTRTVTQPLPQPKGVQLHGVLGAVGSGYGGGGYGAVGGRGAKIKRRRLRFAPTSAPVMLSAPEGIHVRPSSDVKSGRVVVKGSIDRAQIERVFRRHAGKFQRAYERVLREHPGVSGEVMLRVTLNREGRVAKVEIVSSTLNNAALHARLLKLVRRIRFPRPIGGGSVVINYPLAFQR